MKSWNKFPANLRGGQVFAMLLGLAAVLGSNNPARAQSFTMAQLEGLGATGVTIGGKNFYDFSYSSGAVNGAGFANAPTAVQVTVNFTSFTGNPTGVGMSEQLLGFLAGSGGFADVSFSFKVQDLTANIKGADLSIAGSASGVNAIAHGDETILGTAPGGFNATLHTSLPTPAAATTAIVPSQQGLQVTKDFLLFTQATGDFSDISSVVENFYETPQTVVPEPASAVMLAVGAMGLCGFRFRRKK
jgi:hypothetical protein